MKKGTTLFPYEKSLDYMMLDITVKKSLNLLNFI